MEQASTVADMQEVSMIVTAIAALASAIATVVIAILSRSLWQSNKRVEWFTGALESHSEIQLAIAAKEAGMEVIWWDPNIAKVPTVRKHGEPRDLTRIYIYLPPNERAPGRKKS